MLSLKDILRVGNNATTYLYQGTKGVLKGSKAGLFVNFKFPYSWIRSRIYSSLGIHKGRPRYTGEAFSPSKHDNSLFLKLCLFLCVVFALLDPDPDPATPINVDPYVSSTLFD
jgi:hypothetical protein